MCVYIHISAVAEINNIGNFATLNPGIHVEPKWHQPNIPP